MGTKSLVHAAAIVLFALVASACGGSAVETSGPSDSTDIGQSLAFGEPEAILTVVSDPAEQFPKDGIDIPGTGFATRVVQLGFDVDTASEVMVWAIVPTGWTFDAETAAFTDGGEQRMEFYLSCAGECVPKAWANIVGGDDGPLQQQIARYEDKYERAGGNRSGGGGGGSFTGGHTSQVLWFTEAVLFVTAQWHNEGPAMLGCNLVIDQVDSDDEDDYRKLCTATVADWDNAVAGAPEPAPFEATSTASADAIIAAAANGDFGGVGSQGRVAIHDEAEYTVNVALPEGAEVDVGSFGTEVEWPGLHLFSTVELEAACDGICSAQDWETLVNSRTGRLGVNRGGSALDVDRPIDDGWVQSGLDGNERYNIRVLRWDDDADRFFACKARLDEDDFGLAPDVLRMCLSAEPQWFG